MAEHKCSAKVPKRGRYSSGWKPCPHKAKFYRISEYGTHIAYTCGIHEKIDYVDLNWERIFVDTADPEILPALVGRKQEYELECITQAAMWEQERKFAVEHIRLGGERLKELSKEGKLPAYGTTLLRSDRDSPKPKVEAEDT